MRLKRLIAPLTVLAGCLYWSSPTGGLKFIPIYEALTIKAQKSSPPHVAFEELIESERHLSEWARIEQIKPRDLAAEKNNAPLFSRKVELAELVIQKTPERFVPGVPSTEVAERDDSSWMNELSPAQARRLQVAQSKSEIVGEDWSGPSWSEMAAKVLKESGVLTAETPDSKVYVAGLDAVSGLTKTRPPQPQVRLPDYQNRSERSPASGEGSSGTRDDYSPSYGLVDERTDSRKSITGPLEITGGLAVTNEHHIEIRRSDEGILKELGRVNLVQGQYNIDVEDTSGSIVARLVNKEGKILGEGSYRLSKLAARKDSTIAGPKIRIEPHADFGGIIASAYNPKAEDSAPAKTLVTFIKGAQEVAPKKDGAVAMDNVVRGSSTVVRAAAPSHLQTASVVVAGSEFRTQIYPASMIQALQDIIAQQRQQSFEGAPTVIWGRISQDGKSLAGAQVEVESASDLTPVYFNQFMLPDPKLTATSENGLFAFVDVRVGFHSLLATKADAILGYQNVVVEEGSVAQGDIELSTKSESVPLRVYDAFAGTPVPAVITMQSLSADLETQGSSVVSLPHVHRMGIMRVQPDGVDYVAARYVYNDSDEYIHAPVIRWGWLGAIKGYLKIDDIPSTGVVVGFVPDEDFEVYLAAYDQFNAANIVYFDMQGRILQTGKGIAGGGFILYNVPEDLHEVVVVGARTQKVYSRVLPVDPGSLSVLGFREK